MRSRGNSNDLQSGTFRSPWDSEAPDRSVKRRCCRMLRIASDDGAQVALLFFRHKSLSEARMLTTTERESGWSTLVVLKVLASARVWSSAIDAPAVTTAVGDSMSAGVIGTPSDAAVAVGLGVLLGSLRTLILACKAGWEGFSNSYLMPARRPAYFFRHRDGVRAHARARVHAHAHTGAGETWSAKRAQRVSGFH